MSAALPVGLGFISYIAQLGVCQQTLPCVSEGGSFVKGGMTFIFVAKCLYPVQIQLLLYVHYM